MLNHISCYWMHRYPSTPHSGQNILKTNGLALNSLCLWPCKMGGLPWFFWHGMWLIPFVNGDTKSAPKFGSVIPWVTSCLPLCFSIWMIFSHPITKVLKPFIGYCARQLEDSKKLRCYYLNAFQQLQNIMFSWMMRSKSKIPPWYLYLPNKRARLRRRTRLENKREEEPRGEGGRWSTRWTLTVHRTGQTDWWTGQFLALSAVWARVHQPYGALPGFSPSDIPTR